MDLNLYGHKCIVSEFEGANARGYYKTLRTAFLPTEFHRHSIGVDFGMPELTTFLNRRFTTEITAGHVLQQRYDYQEWCPCPECEGTGQAEPGKETAWVTDINLIEMWTFVPSHKLMDSLEALISHKNVAVISDGCKECLGSGQGITPELSQDESDEIFLDFLFQCGLWALGERFDRSIPH